MQRYINIGIILSFMICYLEWGGGHSIFIFRAEYEILFLKTSSTDTFTHPLVIIPFLGQLLVLFTLFQKKPNRKITSAGIILMAILVLFITLAGSLSLNIKIIVSTIPFIILTVIHFRNPSRFK